MPEERLGLAIQQANPVAVANFGLHGASEVGDGPLLERRKRLRVQLLLLEPGSEVTIVDGLVERGQAGLGAGGVAARHDGFAGEDAWLWFFGR